MSNLFEGGARYSFDAGGRKSCLEGGACDPKFPAHKEPTGWVALCRDCSETIAVSNQWHK